MTFARYPRFTAVIAAFLCSFITIGMSVAPAIYPDAALFA